MTTKTAGSVMVGEMVEFAGGMFIVDGVSIVSGSSFVTLTGRFTRSTLRESVSLRRDAVYGVMSW